MAKQQRNQSDPSPDDATDRQRESGSRREGIPDRSFDPGAGYGGAGNDSLYDAGSSYGGQSDIGGSTTWGAAAGESSGRDGDTDVPLDSKRDSAFSAGEGDFDADSPLGGERREPGR